MVEKIIGHVRSKFPDCGVCVLYDLPQTPNGSKPPLIEGYRPDVLAENVPASFTLIGEAKTVKDLETPHSKNQFKAYLTYLRLRPNPHLVVATPWYAVNSARTFLAAAQRETDTNSVQVFFLH